MLFEYRYYLENQIHIYTSYQILIYTLDQFLFIHLSNYILSLELKRVYKRTTVLPRL